MELLIFDKNRSRNLTTPKDKKQLQVYFTKHKHILLTLPLAVILSLDKGKKIFFARNPKSQKDWLVSSE